MYIDKKLIEFFKKHNLYEEEIFDYIRNNLTLVDYDDDTQNIFIGCYYMTDKKNILKGFKLYVPRIYNDITMIVSIHEFVHAIISYKYLGKKYIVDITSEALPMLYEKIYINEHPLIKYGNKLDEMINTNNNDSYSFGLNVRDTLIENYDYNIENSKKLIKNLKKNRKKV